MMEETPSLTKLPSYNPNQSTKESYSRILETGTTDSLKDKVERFKQLKKELADNESLLKVANETEDYSLIPLLYE